MKCAPLWQTTYAITQRGDNLKEKKDILWQLFMETGEPMCWLLSRREDP